MAKVTATVQSTFTLLSFALSEDRAAHNRCMYSFSSGLNFSDIMFMWSVTVYKYVCNYSIRRANIQIAAPQQHDNLKKLKAGVPLVKSVPTLLPHISANRMILRVAIIKSPDLDICLACPDIGQGCTSCDHGVQVLGAL